MSEEKKLFGVEKEGFYSNFGMLMPTGAFREHPDIRKKYFVIKIPIPAYPKILDKLLRPLCRLGLHRWVSLYSCMQYTIPAFRFGWHDGPDPISVTCEEDTGKEVKRTYHYQCARCKAKKPKEVLSSKI